MSYLQHKANVDAQSANTANDITISMDGVLQL